MGEGDDELHLVFDFRLMKSSWWADSFRQFLSNQVPAIPKGGWPTIVLSNHDQLRHIGRYGAGGDERKPAPEPRRSYCSPCLEHPFSITAKKSVCGMESYGIGMCAIPILNASGPSVPDVIRRAHRCSGMDLDMPGLRPVGPGFPCRRTTLNSMSLERLTIRARSGACIDDYSISAEGLRH